MKKQWFLGIWITIKLAGFKQFYLILCEPREKNSTIYMIFLIFSDFVDILWTFFGRFLMIFSLSISKFVDFFVFRPTLSKDISGLRKYFLMNLFLNHIYYARSLQKHISGCVDPLRKKGAFDRKSWICENPSAPPHV